MNTGSDDGDSPPPVKPISRRALAVAVRQLAAVGPAARILAPMAYPEDDVACFDFFRFRVTANPSDLKMYTRTAGRKGFWDCFLLQAAHSEPAIFNAVAAIGALYRKWEADASRDGNALDSSLQKAMTDLELSPAAAAADDDNDLDASIQAEVLTGRANACYNRALSLARDIKSPDAMLILSLALAVTSRISGQWMHSSIHMRAGYNLIGQLTAEGGGSLQSDGTSRAAEILLKLTLEWIVFSESKQVYPLMDNPGASISATSFTTTAPHNKKTTFNAHSAIMALIDIVRRLLIRSAAMDIQQAHTDESIDPARSDSDYDSWAWGSAVRDLYDWEAHVLQALEATSVQDRRGLDLLGVKYLHTNARLLVDSGSLYPDYSELGWDRCLGLFERILALSTLIVRQEAASNLPGLPVTSLDEPAINPSLWLTAVRCRHPLLRRWALAMMRSARKLDGAWMSSSAGAAAEKIIQVEEADSAPILDRMDEWIPPTGAAALEAHVLSQIDAEAEDPRLWLGPRAAWIHSHSRWLVPAKVAVPLGKRVVRMALLSEFDPRMRKSRADLTLTFAKRDAKGKLRRETVATFF